MVSGAVRGRRSPSWLGGSLRVALVVSILCGTTVAFVSTEVLKLKRSPITGTTIDKLFSPRCSCRHRSALIAFSLTEKDILTLLVIDGNGRPVVNLLRFQPERAGFHRFRWNGEATSGRVVADGVYRVEVRLQRQARTLVLPNNIQVDTTRPRVRLTAVRPRLIVRGGSPNSIVAHYTADEPVFAILFVDRRLVVRNRFARKSGELRWYGRTATHLFPSGSYSVTLGALDPAGNRSRISDPVTIVLR